MNTLTLTDHAAVRMAQRSIKLEDAEVIAQFGTEVDDGYLVREKDYQELEKTLKKLLNRFRRVVGKRLVIANGQVITAYHASRKYQRRLVNND